MLKLRLPEAAAAGDLLGMPCPFGFVKKLNVMPQE
jgi:hypothetical protein